MISWLPYSSTQLTSISIICEISLWYPIAEQLYLPLFVCSIVLHGYLSIYLHYMILKNIQTKYFPNAYHLTKTETKASFPMQMGPFHFYYYFYFSQMSTIPNKTEDIPICNWHWQHWQSSLGLHMVSKRWGDIERRRPNDRILGLIKIIILDNTWKTSDIEEPGKSFAEEWSEKCKSRKSCNQGEPRPVSSLPSLVQYGQYSGTLSSVCKYHLLYTQLPP